VGAHDGSDTAYYLAQGYIVVAIEADPTLAGRLNTRFAAERAAGRVILLNVAVTEEDQESVRFYVSRDDWKSSLIREMAQTDGEDIDPVEVPGRSLGSLFDEFGIPWYCKIDIEGCDARAIAGLAKYAGRPPHISCETSRRSIGEVHLDNNLLYPALDAMASAGYSKFKLVDQESLVVLSAENHYAFLHQWPCCPIGRKSLRIFTSMVHPDKDKAGAMVRPGYPPVQQ
jgi:FkbM family methyltransferase